MIGSFVKTLWALLCRVLAILACLIALVLAAGTIARYPNVGLILAALLLWQAVFRRRFGSGWIHGTATVADWGDLIRGNLLGDKGLLLGTAAYLGRPSRLLAIGQLFTAPLGRSDQAVRLFLASLFGRRWHSDIPIRVPNSVHLATFAKTRGGKGVSVVLPTLKSHSGSIVATDPKSENWKKTWRFRKRRFGHKIVKLDPFGKDSDTYNPLDGIDHHSPDFIDACRDLAAAMVVRTGKEHETHFIDSAERMIQAMIALVCVTARPEQRNLQSVRELLASREKYEAAVKLLQNAGDVAGGMLQRLGHSLSWHEGKELASVMSTCQRMMGWLDSPQIAANTATSSFNPRLLLSGKMTIYLCLPPERLTSHAAMSRLWISSIMRAITPGADESRKTLFLLDEVGNMGHLQILEDAVTMFSGMGIRLWFIFQSLDQVKTCFGERATTFLDNIGTQQYFSIQSYDTADAIAKRIGEATVTSVSENDGTSDSMPTGFAANGPTPGSRTQSRGSTSSEIARKLLKPEEIIGLPSDVQIIFHNNHPPILARRILYYNSPLFRFGRAGKSRGVGLAGGILCAFLLFVSLALAAVATTLPSLQRRHDHSGVSFGKTQGRSWDQFVPPPPRSVRPRSG